MRPSCACESDLSFDLLLAGDLLEDDARRVRSHLDWCRTCALRWGEIQAECDAFKALRPALDLRCARGHRWRWLWSPWLPATAAIAASAVLLLVLWPGDTELAGPSLGTRGKGGDVFQLYIRHGEKIRRAGETEVVYPGDQLQLLYSSPRHGFAAVLSRDGAGMASVYFPDGGHSAWLVAAGRDQPLPRSTILDDTLGHELLHALFCSTAVELEPLRADLAAGRPLKAPRGCIVETLQLDKVPAR